MRLLVLRTSSMGDVALLTPVIRGFGEQYKDIKIILVTRKAFSSFFRSSENLELFFPDFKGRHSGFIGIFRLYRDLRNGGRIDLVVDLHDVIRTKILRILFRMVGIRTYTIDKGRREKRLLISGKKTGQLMHSVSRYSETFARAGFRINLAEGPWIFPSEASEACAVRVTGIGGGLNIGVAPYAKHLLKMWPEEYMVELLGKISERREVRFWLFGGNEEAEKLRLLQQKIPGSFLTTGKMTLDEELALIKRLSFMISMDSSNMHMAALAGVKVVSIWGATDPVTGFGAWGQPEDYSIRIPVGELTCRPCSVYGKGTCMRGDHACMKWLTPELVFEKILNAGIL
ncbi:MAG: glycosyltransferase family 9 protein [Bacteroidales bacterium]|nr:glycosyltransferase family 9 protein [Bacteroidales bacterium]